MIISHHQLNVTNCDISKNLLYLLNINSKDLTEIIFNIFSRLKIRLEVERAQIFQARALSVEPQRARACQNSPRACFEPELFTNKNAKI